MRKTLYFILPLILAFTFLTCDDDDGGGGGGGGKKELDQRLVGGRWYFPKNFSSPYSGSLTPKTSDGYYKFTEDSELIYSEETTFFKNIADDLLGKQVYSKDGIVYLKENNKKVMQFAFHSTFPYPNNNTDFYLTGDQRYSLNALASKGDLITYRIFDNGSIYSDSRYGSEWFLVRFKDDGTPYRDYTE